MIITPFGFFRNARLNPTPPVPPVEYNNSIMFIGHEIGSGADYNNSISFIGGYSIPSPEYNNSIMFIGDYIP